MSEGAEEEVHHRPLPSVGIPLLRDEVRASRLRRAIALGVVSAVLVAGGAAALFIPQFGVFASSTSEEATATEPPRAAASPTVVVDAGPPAEARVTPPIEATPLAGDGARTVHPFGEAPGFRVALTNAGIPGESADAITTALTEVMDFRRCRPADQLTLDRDAAGRLVRFEYRASSTQIYEALQDDEGAWTGRQVEVPIERIRLRRGGTITASLGGALERAGLGRALVGTLVETFEREVDFSTDTRAGDTFRIIVDEERIDGTFLRYGRVHAIEVRGQRLGERRAFYYEPREDMADFYDETGRAMHGGWLRTPLRYDHVSSPFDPRRRHPILRRIVPHNGVDYAAGTGTPVWAAADGTLSFFGPRGANGNLVSIQHANGYETHYAHLSRFASGLTTGGHLTQRQIIGYVGSTGRSTGPHLHFGLKRNGRFVDPQAELNGPGRMMPGGYLPRYRTHVTQLLAELRAIDVTPNEAAPEPVPEPAREPATD